METIPLPPDDHRETISPVSTESGSVKSTNGNSPNAEGRSSPPPNCAICLGKCRNKSFTDSCLHQFCFKCLLTWSKVKTECPLCKQSFKAIIHSVKSNHQYEEYPVHQPHQRIAQEPIDLSDLVSATRRFRYRTTLTLPRRETLAIQQFLMHYPLSALMDDVVPRRAPAEGRRSPQHFRRTVYRHNLWARPLPDFTGRFRDCSPEFFRYNESQMHRLLPWLNRELWHLLNENTAHISYVLSRIIELLTLYRITSTEFRDALRCYFGERTEHFLHEFYCFASTPYDLTGYDRNVQYQTDSRVSSVVNEVLSSSDSDGSHDSDIVVVSSSHPAGPPPAGSLSAGPPHAGPPHAGPPPASAAGTSRQPAPAPTPLYPRTFIPGPHVVPIETISHSESDSDSSVMVVGYIKPPHQRTPEHVDLVASDSDVVVQEDAPGTSAGSGGAPAVKLTLSRPRLAAPLSDSDEEVPAPRTRHARRRRERTPPRVDFTPPTESLTPPPRVDDDAPYSPPIYSSSYSPSMPANSPPRVSPVSSPRSPASAPPRDAPPPRYSLPAPLSGDDSYRSSSNADESSSSDSSSRWRPGRRKPKAKLSRRRTRRRASRAASSRLMSEDDGPKISVETQTVDEALRNFRKSRNGKGVKSSRRIESKEPRDAAEAGPSSQPDRKRRGSDGAARRDSRDAKRLKSVVNVMYKDRTRIRSRVNETDDGSDSDSDNIPLNETIKRAHSSRH